MIAGIGLIRSESLDIFKVIYSSGRRALGRMETRRTSWNYEEDPKLSQCRGFGTPQEHFIAKVGTIGSSHRVPEDAGPAGEGWWGTRQLSGPAVA